MRHGPVRPGRRIVDVATARALLAADFAGLSHEEVHILHLDRRLRPIHRCRVRGDAADRVDLPIRRVIHDALALGTHALLLAHNHPGGDAAPSAADKAVTRRLAEIARPLDIRLLDHLVFAGDACVSFRALGLL